MDDPRDRETTKETTTTDVGKGEEATRGPSLGRSECINACVVQRGVLKEYLGYPHGHRGPERAKSVRGKGGHTLMRLMLVTPLSMLQISPCHGVLPAARDSTGGPNRGISLWPRHPRLCDPGEGGTRSTPKK